MAFYPNSSNGEVNPNYTPPASTKKIVYAEWKMVIDDFDNGFGNQQYPHCSNCHRGVYRHDAGSWCPFCGADMKNPMRY